MSGHSRWTQIKHKKALSDAKRGKIFSKLSRLITVAAKEAGPDPKTNSRLARAVAEARAANMPQNNIERAIKKVSDKDSENLKEVLYEAYGPGGSALLISAVTDNPNRTTNEIKQILSRYDGKLGVQGSAMWAFEKSDSDWVSKFPVTPSAEDSKKFESLLEELDNQDEVEEVYSNVDLK